MNHNKRKKHKFVYKYFLVVPEGTQEAHVFYYYTHQVIIQQFLEEEEVF